MSAAEFFLSGQPDRLEQTSLQAVRSNQEERTVSSDKSSANSGQT